MTLPTDFPKVVLHDHLDGGLRPATILELAAASGYDGLPAGDEAGLAAWFDQSGSGSLVGYLAAFDQTVAVMQTPEALQRVAREAVEDHAAAGVVYAEIRFAPSLHTREGMSRSEVIAAVLAGLAEGEAATGLPARVIVDAMRHAADSSEVAATAAEFAGRGVVGFDLAGPEAGYPAVAHAEALRLATEAGLHLTIHAGEAAGPESIADALSAGAERLGHGVRVVDDVTVEGGRIIARGPVAAEVHSRRIPLEICPTSNVGTRAVASLEAHPARMLLEAGFVVTLNTDNRLMSSTTMDGEFALAAGVLGFTTADLRAVTDHAVAAAFCDEQTRAAVAGRVAEGHTAA
ncbi:MAG: adenosine deaminase [Actinobacteria bacterium]|nr:adenosine deaminase [Actinomycetota bacterium]